MSSGLAAKQACPPVRGGALTVSLPHGEPSPGPGSRVQLPTRRRSTVSSTASRSPAIPTNPLLNLLRTAPSGGE
ncbi:hypothetical protein ACVWYT_001401 [Streptomyces sp. TE4109]